MLAWPGWTRRLNQHFPLRYLTWVLCGLLALGLAIGWAGGLADGALVLVFLGLTLLGLRDMRQTKRSILRNYPVIGHLRFLLEFIRPEIRQYFLEGDNEAAPFSRAQRSIVYQRAKGDPDQRPFGTQLDVARGATSGSTTHWCRPTSPATTSASPSGPAARSPTRPVCSTSPR